MDKPPTTLHTDMYRSSTLPANRYVSFVDSSRYFSIKEQYTESYETAIISGLLCNTDATVKYVLGTFLDSCIKNLAETYALIMEYRNKRDDHTISTEEQEALQTTEAEFRRLGFETPHSFVSLRTSVENDEDYKYVYAATLYCIASRTPCPVSCRFDQLFPVQLSKDIHSVLTTTGTTRDRLLYQELIYNAFTLQIVTYTTAKWNYAINLSPLPEPTNDLFRFEHVKIHRYIGLDISKIRSITYYDQCELFYKLLNPEAYKKDDIDSAVMQAYNNFFDSMDAWALLHQHHKEETKKLTVYHVTSTVQSFLQALKIFRKTNIRQLRTSPFENLDDQTIRAFANCSASDVIRDRRLLMIVYDTLVAFTSYTNDGDPETVHPTKKRPNPDAEKQTYEAKRN